jgi:uncharacterized protein YjiS (DUF1127 family)
MTTTTAQRSVHARPRLTARGVLDFFAAIDQRARARHQLAALDDRILRDIGLSRGDVEMERRRSIL